MKKPLYLLLVLCICYSCGEKVSFDEAQPAHLNALAEIPQKYWGTYFDDEDSTIVKIDASTIIEVYTIELSDPYDEIFGGVDDEITAELIEGELQTISIKNDSVFGTLEIPERLFALDQQDVVKHYKGYDYFSILNRDSSYYLRKVSLEGEIITISKIQKVLDVKNLTSIDKASGETGKGLKPTKRQFKKIAQNSFKITKKLRRIN